MYPDRDLREQLGHRLEHPEAGPQDRHGHQVRGDAPASGSLEGGVDLDLDRGDPADGLHHQDDASAAWRCVRKTGGGVSVSRRLGEEVLREWVVDDGDGHGPPVWYVTAVPDREDFRDVVARKRDGRELSAEELRGFVLAYARGDVGDPLAAAFLMAACSGACDAEETLAMTRAMMASGETVHVRRTEPADRGQALDRRGRRRRDPGVRAARGVARPGGREALRPGARPHRRDVGQAGGDPRPPHGSVPAEIERQVGEVGCAVAAQSPNLVPADGALYALRDATATVPTIPLIAASIMSKKLAVETDLILLDVKAGRARS